MLRTSSIFRRTPLLAVSLTLPLAVSACSSSYVPQRNGKIATTMKAGQIGYERDGRFHSHGLFGGGLVDAVRGVPAAEAAANTHYSRSGWGFASMLGGLVCSTVALSYSLSKSYNSENGSGSDEAALLSLGCLGITVFGGGLLISAMPYRFDAVNIFNDAVQPTGPVYMPGQAPSMIQRPSY